MKKKPAKRKTSSVAKDEILPEYDFSRGRRNEYASQYVSGSLVVVLEPDVASTFGSSKEANDALRALAGIIQHSRGKTTPRRRGA